MDAVEEKFSKKFEDTASEPAHRGAYYQEDAAEKGMALVQAKHKDTKLYWLVDIEEDRIYSSRFFAYGGKLSLGVGESLCVMSEGLTVSEACSLLGSDVDSSLRDEPDVSSVPESKSAVFENVEKLLAAAKEEYPAAKAVAEASRVAKEKQGEIVPSTAELSINEMAWMGMTKEERTSQVNLVLDEKVRAALLSDGGNVAVLDILDDKKIIIQYQGACGSCGSSIGATLSFIENTLRNNIHKDLVVVPDTYL
jgi:NifU-like protein